MLEDPKRFDLPCLWPEPIPVDRALPLETPIAWHEYELTLYPLPGHTYFACAIAFEVDGRRVLAIGDQYSPTTLNYQYRNRFERHDFIQTGELLRALRPDLLIGGHFFPHEVEDGYLDSLVADAHRVAELHDELLPAESFGERGFGAWIEPYRSTVAPGGTVVARRHRPQPVRARRDRDRAARRSGGLERGAGDARGRARRAAARPS